MKNHTHYGSWRVAVNHAYMMIDTATGEMKLDGEANEAVLKGLEVLGLTLEALAQPVRPRAEAAPQKRAKGTPRRAAHYSPAVPSVR